MDDLAELRLLAMDQMLVLRELIAAVQGLAGSILVPSPEVNYHAPEIHLPAPVVHVEPQTRIDDATSHVTPDQLMQTLDIVREGLMAIERKIGQAPATTIRGGGISAETLQTAVTVGSNASSLSSRFARVLKFEPSVGEEIRREETLTDDYHGAAPDGSNTAGTVWDVVRFYKTATLITRVRFRTGVAWDSRATGW